MHDPVWVEEFRADGNAALAATRFGRIKRQANQIGEGVRMLAHGPGGCHNHGDCGTPSLALALALALTLTLALALALALTLPATENASSRRSTRRYRVKLRSDPNGREASEHLWRLRPAPQWPYDSPL
jgi:hypothetical protein